MIPYQHVNGEAECVDAYEAKYETEVVGCYPDKEWSRGQQDKEITESQQDPHLSLAIAKVSKIEAQWNLENVSN